ncbi:MAG: isochorismatase family protein, partial [Pirellulales bacterium]
PQPESRALADCRRTLRLQAVVFSFGYTSNTCIEATTRSAVDLDYHITLVNDAVASWTPKDHHVAVAVNYECLAQTVTTTEALVQLLETLGGSRA